MLLALLRSLLPCLLVGAALAAAPLTAAPPAGDSPASAPADPPASQPKKPRASFKDVKVLDLDGKSVSLTELAGGKPMIVEMWSVTCAPCIKQRKIFHDNHAKLNEHVRVVAVSADDSADKVKSYLKKNPSEGIVEVMATPDFRAAIKPIDTRVTIPKIFYVSSKGAILDVAYELQDAAWLIARAKTLK